MYILHNKIDQFRTCNNINLFKNYKGKGQLLWNYYQSIVKQVDSSEMYGYVCDYLVPYLGYMLCFHTDLKNEDDEIIEIKKELFNNICEVIADNYPSNFDSDQLFEKLKKVPIISIKNDKISFSHEYFSNFASAVHFLNNDLIYLNKGTNPLLKREQRTTDDNYIVTELYVDLYNRGVEDNNRDFLIKRLRDNIKDNNDRSMKGRFRNIINDIVYYPIYNRTACFDYIDNLPDILSDDTAYGDDDFGQWSKAFCLEKMARLYYDNFDKDYSTAELYLLKAHEILIGILNKNTNCDKQFNEIVESNIDEILEYDSNLVDEKRVYHVLGKIYSNYEKITRVSSAYKIYEVASVGCHFSCNILADYYERIHDYNSAEQYYMKSIKMGDIWANKPLINLYLKSDFNEYYEPYKSLEEQYKLVKERLGNISYSNVSNIFITIYKADILKKINDFYNTVSKNSKFEKFHENEAGNNILKNRKVFDDFIKFIFSKIEEITSVIYSSKDTPNKEKEFTRYIDDFYENLNLLSQFLNECDLEVTKKVTGICMGIGTTNRFTFKSIGRQDDLNLDSRLVDQFSIFDLASVTKLFTAIVINILCNDENCKMNFTSKIIDLDSNFCNLGETTVNDLLTFSVKVVSDRLSDCDTDLTKIYNCSITDSNDNPYTDMGSIVLELIINKVTGRTLDYWINKLIVAKVEGCNITSNIYDINYAVSNDYEYRKEEEPYRTNLGQIHDYKARVLNSICSDGNQICHGHAGLFASADDLAKLFITLLKGKIIDVKFLKKNSYKSDRKIL